MQNFQSLLKSEWAKAKDILKKEWRPWVLRDGLKGLVVLALWAIGGGSLLTSKASTPAEAWLWLLFVAVSLIGAVWIVLEMRRQKWLRKYSRGSFFGLQWDWGYTLGLNLCGLKICCPVCKKPVSYKGAHAVLHSDNFLCSQCSYDSLTHGGENRESIPIHPEREAQKRIKMKFHKMRFGLEE